MAEMSTVVEGNVKYRDGKKWKPRWCVMKKPSPVADRLIVHLFKDVKESVKGGHPKTTFPLDGFYGLESGICFDKETSVLAIICQKQITLLAFESRETLIQFEIKIRRSLGEEHQFPVRTIKVPSHSKLPLDLLRMHIHGQRFCLTGHIPPKILCSWQVSELRRFGTIDGKFCFEGGSRCGKGQGSHVLQTDQADEISEIISHASVGKSAPLIKRQTGKRRSEFLDPVKHVVSDNVFKKFQNTQVFADQNYHEDNSWPRYKRHSISFTDYRRAKTYTEKQRLQSIENVEKERLMAIYDVPPRRIRKVEHVPSSNDNTSAVRSYDVNVNAVRNLNAQNSQGNENYLNWTGEFNNNVMSYQVPMTTVVSIQSETTTTASNLSDTTSSHGSVLSLQSLSSSQNTVHMSSSAPVLSCYGNQSFGSQYKQHSQSVPSQIAEDLDCIISKDKRDEVMRRLNQTEQDLEKEMSLLDEMLQICQRSEGASDDIEAQKPPPLPVKLSQLRSFMESQDVSGSLDNISISSDNTHCRPLPHSGYTGSIVLSPNLVNKLRKIPKRSKINDPLPYVNLSKFDGGDFGTSHVHIPAASTSAPDGGSSWSDLQRARSKGYDNVRVERDKNKDNKRISVSLPGSSENLKGMCGSDLQLNRRVRNHSFSNEPIYANERCETPPPELPPKGPALKSKQRLSAASRPPAPPRPPDRQPSLHQRQNKQKSQYQSPKPSAYSVSLNSSQQEDYFLMGNFEKEPTHCRIDYSESQRLNESLSGRTVVNLPPRDQNSTKLDPDNCYMDMSGFSDLERSKSMDSNSSPRPKYVRSVSASGMIGPVADIQKPLPKPETVSAGNSPKEPRRAMPIREENYMLMSTVSKKRPVIENLNSLSEYINSSQVDFSFTERFYDENVYKNISYGASDLSVDMKADENDDNITEENKSKDIGIEMPFDNLIDFTLPPDNMKASKTVQNVSSEKSESSSGKTPGFFSRLMRRNSKDRKCVSQSHENLLSTVSSEPTIKEDVVIVTDSSSSEDNSRAQSQQDLVFGPTDRNRSSSFPNRSSFLAMNESNSSSSTGISILSQQSDLGATNSSLNSCSTVSTRASSNEGQLNENMNTSENMLSDSEKEIARGNYDEHSYFYMGPLENRTRGSETDREKLEGSERQSSCVEGDMNESERSEKCSDDQAIGKVFTVLNVQGGHFDKNTCKTDDEKLIDLWHSTHSLNSDTSEKIADLKSKLTLPLEELSPDEKASAIARHISSLPPFVPPKMKTYPTKLSPVLERTTPKKERPEPLNLTGIGGKDDSEVMSPSLMKQQAKATLRITPPSEDENGKIWIPRTTQNITETVEQPVETKSSTLVVDISDLGEADSISLSSLESCCHGEEVVRSSPAATILRPRSGKEYQKVERRRTVDESSTTSPLTTPQSPATGSVFTFDNFGTVSLSSGVSGQGDLHSPKILKASQAEQLSVCAASLRSECLQSPKAMYMNLDFTESSPPESPMLPPCQSAPIMEMEPMLNYAEIDLSESGKSDNVSQFKKLNYAEMDLSTSDSPRFGNIRQAKKAKKTPEPIPIEYSMIDMVATRAAQKARKEHAQSRDGSLRRDRYSSVPSGMFSTKERLGSLSSRTQERKQSAAASAGQSSSSVDSTNI